MLPRRFLLRAEILTHPVKELSDQGFATTIG
jgi:hypothetical protein